MKHLYKALLVLLLALAGKSALAQMIEITMPFPQSGPASIISRGVQQYLQEQLNTEVTVVSRPGAEGKVGTRHFIRDNNTRNIILVTQGTMVTSRLTDKEYAAEVNPDQLDIVPLAWVSQYIVVSSSSKITNLQEFIQQSRQRPVVCGYTAATYRLTASYLKGHLNLTNLDIVYFKGLAEQATSVIGGHLECGLDPMSLPIWQSPEHKARYRIIAVADDDNSRGLPLLKDVAPGLTSAVWFGMAVKRDMPEPQKRIILNALRNIHKDAKFLALMTNAGGFRVQAPPASFANSINQETKFWGDFLARTPKLLGAE